MAARLTTEGLKSASADGENAGIVDIDGQAVVFQNGKTITTDYIEPYKTQPVSEHSA
jgi:hypothetical protein